MEYVLIPTAAFFIALITLLSGFGLGTVLMPVFALFFPLPIAIAAVALVHFANNLFKTALVGRLAKWSMVVLFGMPALIGSALGAYILGFMTVQPHLVCYKLGNHQFAITPIDIAIGSIIIAAALLELFPAFAKLSFSSKYIPLGGFLSGFLGGFSGNQGVLRAAYLTRAGLNTQEYIGTCVICSIMVDAVRIAVYGWAMYCSEPVLTGQSSLRGVVIAASLAAFAGSYFGARLMHKTTIRAVQLLICTMLLILGLGIAAGMTHPA